MSNKSADKKEGEEPLKKAPWGHILGSQSSFLNNLECIGEMVSLVLPVLKNRDQERKVRINQLIEEIETEKGKSLRIKSLTDIKEFAGHMQKMKQGDRMFRQGVITSIVSKFDEFVIDVLNVCYRENPGWLKNPDKKISYKELLEIESLDALKDEIISKEIDGLMRDSHHIQIAFLDSKLKLGIEREFPSWLEFLEITERRNLFVHTGGTVSPQYLENCKKWKISLDEQIKEGGHLTATDEYIQKAIDCFYELSVRVAQAIVRRIFPVSSEDADNKLNNQSVDLLSEERWELAERIFNFALSIPEDLTSKGEMKYYFLINRCIAMKHLGKSIHECLHSVDWRPFHPKYNFAVAILEERYDEAEKLMRSTAVREEVTEQCFKEWPLLRDFRKTEAFQSAYKEIFGKDYGEELIEEVEREIKAQQCMGLPDSGAPTL
ncbi:MAG: hypothetical protein M0Q44_01650 [Methylobacter sp.]|jgi:hypothetical protein|nr:hypothetical protein [Methylobacter sp.]